MSRTALVPENRVAEGDSMIRVERLTKKFGDFVAVDDISFDVKKGEIFGLLGPNGAGKSTTLRILSTLARPTKGTAIIGGYDIVKDDTEVRKLIGIVSEKMIMYDRLTARENLWFFGSLFDIPSDVLTQRIDELLDLVQLTKWKDAQVGTFSTGMRQRMNVVRVPAQHAPGARSRRADAGPRPPVLGRDSGVRQEAQQGERDHDNRDDPHHGRRRHALRSHRHN